MQIIREDGFVSAYMLALLINWNIKRCNQQNCRELPTTIIGGAGKDVPVFGLCEEHYQMCNVPNGGMLNLEFDDFDAFDNDENKQS